MSATSTHTRTSTSDDQTENGIVRDAVLASVEVRPIQGDPFAVIVPRGAGLALIDPEVTYGTPNRPRGTARPMTVEALIGYCTEHDAGTTEVWITPERIVAVLNAQANTADAIGWGDHRADLTLKASPEWDHWMKYDGEMIDQATFAEHIEDCQSDIREPASAEMLEVVQHIQVSRSASFRSSQHLHSGRVGFLYDETDQATASEGKTFEIPEEFTLGIPVYVGEQAYSVKVRFRYRLKDGALMLGYKIDRPDLIRLDAARQIARRLRGHDEEGNPIPDAPALPFAAVFDGTPADAVEAGLLNSRR